MSSKIISFDQDDPKARQGLSTYSAMKSELVAKASEIIPDPQVLINMVSKRVRQLNAGRPPLITPEVRMGQADIALTEIIEEKVVLEAEGEEDS